MKEKLHKQLNRLAKHILAAQDSSELSSLYEASKSLYEKLAVLKFIEKELEDPLLDLEKNKIADEFKQLANEVLASNESVPENNPHVSDIITPGIDTIKDMVSEMPQKQPPASLNTVPERSKASLNATFSQELSFGLNDRIAFVEQLFEGEEAALKRVVSQLNTIETEERALSFIENLVKPEYGHWKGKEAYERRFINLVSQKYQ